MALTEDATIESFAASARKRSENRYGGAERRAVTVFAADKLSDVRGLARGVVQSEDSIEARMGTSVEAMTRHYEDSVRTIETTDPSCEFIPELRAELDALGGQKHPGRRPDETPAHGRAPGGRRFRTDPRGHAFRAHQIVRS